MEEAKTSHHHFSQEDGYGQKESSAMATAAATTAVTAAAVIIVLLANLVAAWRRLAPAFLFLAASPPLPRRVCGSLANPWRLSLRGISISFGVWTLDAEALRLDGLEKGRLRLRARGVVFVRKSDGEISHEEPLATSSESSAPLQKVWKVVIALSKRITLLTVDGLQVRYTRESLKCTLNMVGFQD